jgi:hypothetical protein
MKAVFSRPDRPSPRPRGREGSPCSKAHHVREAHQLATPGAFLHLTVDQLRRHLPLEYFPPSATHLKPVSEKGREAQRTRRFNHRW